MQININIQAQNHQYSIVIGRNNLQKLSEYITFPQKTIIITDNNIPNKYIDVVKQQTNVWIVYRITPGEDSKTISVYQDIINLMLENDFSRNDLVIAIGGGVVGDLAGFVASTYKRGCRFVNIPTSTLAMVDSSIGGKVAVNLNKIKNCVGSFYQPELVLIDFETLSSLPIRQYNNGLVEALKTGLIGDASLFECFKEDKLDIETIVVKSLEYKKKIVEADPLEKGIRKVLNFGHTVGHAIETLNLGILFHGEAVAKGMMYFLNPKLKGEVIEILQKLNISIDVMNNYNEIYDIILNDKKVNGENITIVKVDEIGRATLATIKLSELLDIIKAVR